MIKTKADFNREEAEKLYPFKLEMKFKTQDDLEIFLSRYSNSGEQNVQCYEVQVSEDGTYSTEMSYDWEQPTLFLDVESDEENY